MCQQLLNLKKCKICRGWSVCHFKLMATVVHVNEHSSVSDRDVRGGLPTDWVTFSMGHMGISRSPYNEANWEMQSQINRSILTPLLEAVLSDTKLLFMDAGKVFPHICDSVYPDWISRIPQFWCDYKPYFQFDRGWLIISGQWSAISYANVKWIYAWVTPIMDGSGHIKVTLLPPIKMSTTRSSQCNWSYPPWYGKSKQGFPISILIMGSSVVECWLVTVRTWVWISVTTGSPCEYERFILIFPNKKQTSLRCGTSILTHAWCFMLSHNWWKNKYLAASPVNPVSRVCF